MRYAYAITAALLAGGATATLTMQQPVGAQVAQNAPGSINAEAPRPGAPMSFADLAAKLQPAVVNISTTQKIQVRNGGTSLRKHYGIAVPCVPSCAALARSFCIKSVLPRPWYAAARLLYAVPFFGSMAMALLQSSISLSHCFNEP